MVFSQRKFVTGLVVVYIDAEFVLIIMFEQLSENGIPFPPAPSL